MQQVRKRENTPFSGFLLTEKEYDELKNMKLRVDLVRKEFQNYEEEHK